MKCLLDTHVLLWALSEPEKLSSRAIEVLENTSNELWISSISLFEISTKSGLGKLTVPASLLKDWRFVFTKLGASLLGLNGDAAVRAGRWEVEHRDPFDRIIAAQAVEENLTLISKDAAFSQFPNVQLLW